MRQPLVVLPCPQDGRPGSVCESSVMSNLADHVLSLTMTIATSFFPRSGRWSSGARHLAHFTCACRDVGRKRPEHAPVCAAGGDLLSLTHVCASPASCHHEVHGGLFRLSTAGCRWTDGSGCALWQHVRVRELADLNLLCESDLINSGVRLPVARRFIRQWSIHSPHAGTAHRSVYHGIRCPPLSR